MSSLSRADINFFEGVGGGDGGGGHGTLGLGGGCPSEIIAVLGGGTSRCCTIHWNLFLLLIIIYLTQLDGQRFLVDWQDQILLAYLYQVVLHLQDILRQRLDITGLRSRTFHGRSSSIIPAISYSVPL